MDHITHLQAAELIDNAAMEDRLYHFNGGQSYIRMIKESDILMVIDTSATERVLISIHDGEDYFKTYPNGYITCSERMRNNPMTSFFKLPVETL